MGVGLFTDKNVWPTEKEVASTLGLAQKNWNSCIKIVREHSAVIEEFKFCYGKKYGWARQFRSKGKLLLSLYPNEDYFVAQIILSLKNLKDAYSLCLHKSALDAIQTANEYPEGKWLFISVKDESDLVDIRNLLKIKTTVTRVQ